jgi:hypothetical protein
LSVWNSSTARDSSPIVADRHAPAIEIGHDASGAMRMDQCVADQVSQGAPNRSFDAVHHDGAFLDLLQREFDSGVQR